MPIRRDLLHHYKTAEWFAARDACKERAGNRCQHCGIHGGAIVDRPCAECRGRGLMCSTCQGAGKRKAKVVLTVAHLNHNPADNSPENLACLCAGCHLRHDQVQHMHSRQVNRDIASKQLRFDSAQPGSVAVMTAPPTPPPPPADAPKPSDDPTSIDPADIDDDKDLDLNPPPEGNP